MTYNTSNSKWCLTELYLQPNYGASVSGRRLVDPNTVTLGGLATALNSFFVTFLERCIKEN
jgi:hypothetical protein